jgi:hypothetical protein
MLLFISECIIHALYTNVIIIDILDIAPNQKRQKKKKHEQGYAALYIYVCVQYIPLYTHFSRLVDWID